MSDDAPGVPEHRSEKHRASFEAGRRIKLDNVGKSHHYGRMTTSKPIDTPLRDGAIFAIWRQLSTEQRMYLLGVHHGRIGDVTLGDIERVRRELPELRLVRT